MREGSSIKFQADSLAEILRFHYDHSDYVILRSLLDEALLTKRNIGDSFYLSVLSLIAPYIQGIKKVGWLR